MSKTPRIDPRLMAQGRRTRGTQRASILASILAAWAVIGQALCLAHIVNAVSFRHVWSTPGVAPWAAAFFVLALLRAALTHLAERCGFKAAAAIKTGLRRDLLAALFAQGPLGAARADSADFAATALEGVEALEPYFSRYLPQMALCAAVPLAILVLVYPLDWMSGTILLVAGPLIPLFMVFVGYAAEAVNQRQWEKMLRLSTHFLDILQGLTTLKLFGRARDEISILTRIGEDYRRTTMQGLRIAFLTSAVLEFFASLAIALVAVLFGARLIHNHVDFWSAFLVLLLAPEFFVPLRGLAVHYHARMSAIAAARQIFSILDGKAPPAGTAVAPASPIGLACENLVFSHGGAKILDDVTAHVPAGRVTAIVGASGAGKTTLARLLLNFSPPESGRILLDGGQNLAGISAESWWAQCAWVPQNPRLFHGSIADNLRLARPDASLAEMREAAAQAHALCFIDALADGFATPVGEAGANFSGGEIQRLALARAFLKRPRLLLLDEATAHLDPGSEAAVLDSLAALVPASTVILIAHRLAMAARADQVLVMQAGRIVQSGAPAALLAEPGPYRALAEAQGFAACAS